MRNEGVTRSCLRQHSAENTETLRLASTSAMQELDVDEFGELDLPVFRLIIFSMVSASYWPSAFSFLCSEMILSLVSSSTQASRRNTVSGIITRRYCGGR